MFFSRILAWLKLVVGPSKQPLTSIKRKSPLNKFQKKTSVSKTGFASSTPSKKTGASSPSSKFRYGLGKHGFKKKEQGRLSKKHDVAVSGKTHESEHTVGFAVLNKGSGDKRGSTSRARHIENDAPAYQEQKKMHRGHIGTGTRKQADASGFTGDSYRETQRKLIESGDVSSAVQINQLGYAFLKDEKKGVNFQGEANSAERKAARDSYLTMVENMKDMTYVSGDKDVTKQVDAVQKAEMYLARKAAETGKWPTQEEIDAVKKKFGITQSKDKQSS
ncbi:MAG: hypothetical protein AAF320_00190 [Myxococcota bacterium]